MRFFLLRTVILLTAIFVFTISFLFLSKDEASLVAEDMAIPVASVAKEDNAYFDFIDVAGKTNFTEEKVKFMNDVIAGKQWDIPLIEEILQANKEILADDYTMITSRHDKIRF